MGVDLYNGNKKYAKVTEAITYVTDQAINRVFKQAKLAPQRRMKFKSACETLYEVILEIVVDRRAKLRQAPKPKDVCYLLFNYLFLNLN